MQFNVHGQFCKVSLSRYLSPESILQKLLLPTIAAPCSLKPMNSSKGEFVDLHQFKCQTPYLHIFVFLAVVFVKYRLLSLRAAF